MIPLRVITLECPQCHRRTSVIIDIKTAVKAFCPKDPIGTKIVTN